jgi:hypothetical protein
VCDTHALTSVNGDGAVWPEVEQEEPRLFQNASTDRACRVGGLDRPFLLVPSLWASKEKELGRRQASESPPQASNLAITSSKCATPNNPLPQGAAIRNPFALGAGAQGRSRREG